MILADSDAWIDFIKRPRARTAEVMRDLLGSDDLAITGMVLTEVLRGTRGGGRFRSLIDAVPFLEMSKDIWMSAARIAADLDRKGASIPLTDACIAAVAIDRDCELFTRGSHFQRIPGLRLYKPEGDAHA